MRTISPSKLLHRLAFALFFVTAFAYAASPSISDEFVDRRISAGAKLFRALLAADVDIAGKVGGDGHLRLGLLYIDDVKNAEKVADTLLKRADPRIRKINASIKVVTFADCVHEQADRFAGIFLTQRLSDAEVKALIEYANEQNLIIFSPFEGDVERGVQSGIAVEARVRPYVNTKALQTANVRLKSFFMRVAKHYDE